MRRFQLEYMGRGPQGHSRSNLIGDLLVIRLQGVLTAAEQHTGQVDPVRDMGGTCSNKYGLI